MSINNYYWYSSGDDVDVVDRACNSAKFRQPCSRPAWQSRQLRKIQLQKHERPGRGSRIMSISDTSNSSIPSMSTSSSVQTLTPHLLPNKWPLPTQSPNQMLEVHFQTTQKDHPTCVSLHHTSYSKILKDPRPSSLSPCWSCFTLPPWWCQNGVTTNAAAQQQNNPVNTPCRSSLGGRCTPSKKHKSYRCLTRCGPPFHAQPRGSTTIREIRPLEHQTLAPPTPPFPSTIFEIWESGDVGMRADGKKAW